MKGKMVKQENRWYVMCIEEGDWETFYPLSPHDVNQIEEDTKRFDNIEARIAAYPDVEFVIEDFWETGMEEVIKVATLVPDYPELEGTNNLCNDIIQKRTGKMTEEEWQAAERAQTFSQTEISDEQAIEMLKDMNKQPMRFHCVPKEISDGEIERLLKERWGLSEEFITACKWYREQYKKK